MGFSRQEYWSGLLFPSPGDLPHPGIEPHLPHCQVEFPPLSHQGSPGHRAAHRKVSNFTPCLGQSASCVVKLWETRRLSKQRAPQPLSALSHTVTSPESHLLLPKSGRVTSKLSRMAEQPFWSKTPWLGMGHPRISQSCAYVLSHFRRVPTIEIPRTVAHLAPLSMGFSRQDTGVGRYALLQGPSPVGSHNPEAKRRWLFIDGRSFWFNLRDNITWYHALGRENISNIQTSGLTPYIKLKCISLGHGFRKTCSRVS